MMVGVDGYDGHSGGDGLVVVGVDGHNGHSGSGGLLGVGLLVVHGGDSGNEKRTED